MTDSEFFGASRFKPFKDAIFNFYNLEYSWDKIKVANCDDESELCLWLKMLGKPYNVSVSFEFLQEPFIFDSTIVISFVVMSHITNVWKYELRFPLTRVPEERLHKKSFAAAVLSILPKAVFVLDGYWPNILSNISRPYP